MKYGPFEKYVESRKGGLIKRRCPFCGQLVEEEDEKDIEFVVHLGKQTPDHLSSKEWKAYIKRINPTGAA